MNRAGFNEEKIVLLYRHMIQEIAYRTVIYCLLYLISFNITVKAIDERGILLGIKNIPEFCLAKLALICKAVFIVGMNLYRKVLICIDELYKDREMTVCNRGCMCSDIFRMSF